MRRFFRGMRYPFGGMSFVLRTPSVYKLALPIVLCAILILGFVLVAGIRWGGGLIDAVWATPEREGFWGGVLSVLHGLYAFVFAAGLVVIGYYVWMALTALVTAPLKDLLSEKIETMRTGREGPPLSLPALVSEVGRTLRVEGGKLAVYVALMFPLWVASFAIPWLGQLLLTVVGWYFTAVYLCFDFLDWPMSRRGWGFRHRFGQIRRNQALSLGFGTSCWLLLFVPIVNVFLVPGAVAGGTNLFVDLEEAGAFAPDQKEGGALAGR
ncbi:MAG: EI24 domain-containing protein [Deltaproteobacteria bacterium]|nr:EI24 domain-containing protein [Deltaproteobacteria bacterium]